MSDHFDAPKVVLINKTLALQYWPTVEACLGQRIYTMQDANTIGTVMAIVGVVGDVKDSPTDARAQAAFYEPFLQSPSFGNYVALRATTHAEALIPAVREVAQQMGNDLSIQEIRSMERDLRRDVIRGHPACQRDCDPVGLGSWASGYSAAASGTRRAVDCRRAYRWRSSYFPAQKCLINAFVFS